MEFSEILDNCELWAKKLKLGSKMKPSKEFELDGLDKLLSPLKKRKVAKPKKIDKPHKNTVSVTSEPEITVHRTKKVKNDESRRAEVPIKNSDLQRRVRGQLNRLGSSNISKIASELELLLHSVSRHEMRQILTFEIIHMLSNQPNLLETFLATYSVLITALSSKFGSHLAAHFVENIVKKLFDLSSSKEQTNNRIAINFAHIISFLYISQVIDTVLIYDLVRHFAEEICELSTEILLKLLWNSGSQLYKDDPSSLKDIISLIKERQTKTLDAQISSRFKFLMEMIDDLKNNKKRIIKEDHNSNLISLLKSNKPNFSPLSLTVSSIVDGIDFSDPQAVPEKFIKAVSNNNGVDSLLLSKAHQSMNTDIRRAIFIVIMGSEDYLDAYERLSKLQLTAKQTPEIARVLVHCCSHELTYNPYYSYLSHSVIKNGMVRTKSFTFCLWDILKSIQSGELVQLAHIYHAAKLFGSLLSTGSLSILALKMARFDLIEHIPHLFLFIVLMISDGILGSMKNQTLEQWIGSFGIVASGDYDLLKEGLVYFFSKWEDKMKRVIKDKDDQRIISRCTSKVLSILSQ